MAFDQFQFKYTPPQTVAASPAAAQTAAPATAFTSDSNQAAETSAAGRLIARLDALSEMNDYLQQVLLARCSTLSVTHDPAVDPETARALQTLYPSSNLPGSLPVAMYNRTLDAELAALQIDFGLGNESAYEVNPHQVAALSQINQAIENGLVDSGEFNYHLPLLLRTLKGDAVVFNNLRSQLGSYPVMNASAPSIAVSGRISMAGLDLSVSADLGLNAALDKFTESYASVYKLSTAVGVAAEDVDTLVATCVAEPAENIVRMIALMQSLQGFVHKPRMKSLVDGLSGLVFVQLIAEAAGMKCMADQFIQVAVQPMRSITSSMGMTLMTLAAADQTVSDTAAALRQPSIAMSGSLKGISLAYDCGMPHNAKMKKPASARSLDKFSKGMMAMATHVQWAMDEANKKIGLLDEQFNKLLNRRIGDMNGMIDLMCSMQALNTVQQIAQAAMQFKSNIAVAAGTISQTEAIGQILNGMQSPTGNSFLVSNGTVQAVPPSTPAPSARVQSMLSQGGLNLIVPSSAATRVSSTGAVHAS